MASIRFHSVREVTNQLQSAAAQDMKFMSARHEAAVPASPPDVRYWGQTRRDAGVPRPPSLTDGVDKVDEATALAPAELLMGFRLIDPPPPGRCVWNCDLGYAGTTFIAFGGGRQIWFASVLRFCTIAARWNSSRAPERPRNRMRSKR